MKNHDNLFFSFLFCVLTHNIINIIILIIIYIFINIIIIMFFSVFQKPNGFFRFSPFKALAFLTVMCYTFTNTFSGGIKIVKAHFFTHFSYSNTFYPRLVHP